ncbi:Uncharacterised protein [Vibrio cholerae]|nr:Uncharacterised protein [Vibrio cholerae]CSI71269.1 Uncharacterised protein [Vibrio cholerae]
MNTRRCTFRTSRIAKDQLKVILILTVVLRINSHFYTTTFTCG